MNKEAMKLALEALQGIHVGNMTPMAEEYWNKAIKALEEALAKQEQGEPVAWEVFALKFGNGTRIQYGKPENLPKYLGCRPLYTTPQQRTWGGLTDDEMYQVMQDRTWMHTEGLCRAIEAKLKEKNT
jgi:hypothetical protein